MAEQLDDQKSLANQDAVAKTAGGDGDGKGVAKTGGDILNQNRVKLYNDIIGLKDPSLSNDIKKIGFKKFSSLIQEDRDFQSALITDLNERGFKISNEDFMGAYAGGRTGYVYDFGQIARDEAAANKAEMPVTEEDNSLLGQIKGLGKNLYKTAKEAYNEGTTFLKRGWYTGLAGRGAQAENFATGTVDTKNLAEYLKKANDLGTTQVEAEFAKDEGFLKDADDFMAILIPSVMESFANMAGAGYQKLIGGTVAGAGIGAATSGAAGAAAGTVAGPVGTAVFGGAGYVGGAIAGGAKGLQYAMLQQGYNLEFVGTVMDELQKKGLVDLNADVKTIQKQLDNSFADKELMAPIFEKANTRAAAITGTDWVLSGMGGRVLSNLGKSKIAGRALNTPVGQMFSKLAERTVSNPAYRRAARLANRVADIDRKIAKTGLGKAGAAIGVADMASGAAGEMLAQGLTEDQFDWKSIAIEAGAEGKFINILRQLGKVGEKKIEQKAISQFATEKNLPPGPASEKTKEKEEFGPATEQEFNDYKKGTITPERAASIIDDVDIALQNSAHLEKVAATDEWYGKMVKDAYEKHIAAVETQKLNDVAIADVANLRNKSVDDIRAAIDEKNTATYNPEIAQAVKRSLNTLKQQYKEKNDSENASGLSSEVGAGQKPQQAESQQGASEEETGNGGVLETAAAEERIAEIDEFLADNDKYFQDHGENILSPEEIDDLMKERASLVQSNQGGGAAASTAQQTGGKNVQVEEGTQSVGGVSPQPASTTMVGGVSQAAAPQGTSAQQPVTTAAQGVGGAVPQQKGGGVAKPTFNKKTTATFEPEGKKITPNQTPGAYDAFRMTISDDGQYATYEIDPSLQRGYNELLTTGPKLTFNLFESSQKLGSKNSFETVNPGILKKMPDGSWQIIKKAQVNVYQTVAPDKNQPTFSRRPLSFEEPQPAAQTPAPATQTKTQGNDKAETNTETKPQTPTKNALKKPAKGKHSSPYKFETFELGVNEKRGKSLGHGVYLAKQQESTASNFSNVSLREGRGNFLDAARLEAEKKGYKYRFNNPAINILYDFVNNIVTEDGKVLMDVTGDIEQDVRSAAELYNRRLKLLGELSEANKERYASEEDINNAVEFAKKHEDKLGAAYEYEMEYETDGYIVPDTTSKVATLPKEILNAISSFSPEAKAVVDAAVKNNKATFQDLYNNLVGVKGLDSPKGVSDFLDSKGIIGQNDNGQVLIYNDKKVNVISRKEISYAEKKRELAAAAEKASKGKPQTKTKGKAKAETKTETKPQITKKDVSIRKGKDFATEGVYEVMANGEVIGRMYYDKSLYNAWVDADAEPSTPSTFKGLLGTKADAVDSFVNRYNATGKPAAAKVETKGETKAEGKNKEKAKSEPEPMPKDIEEAYIEREDLKLYADAYRIKRREKGLDEKTAKELADMEAKIAVLDKKINAYEKANKGAEQGTKTETKGETKKETKAESVFANNVESLTEVNENLFGLDKEKASAAAVIMDSMIEQMAKRAGVTKEEMYAKLEFRKATAKGLPKGVKLQLDAWHGSPYQFAKFMLENIDTGEGAQAFGWGLYFTDLQDIATYYANNVSNQNLDGDIAKAKSIVVENYYDNGKSENLIDAIKESFSNSWERNNSQILIEIAAVLNGNPNKELAPSIIKAILNNKDVLGDIGRKAVYKVNLFAGKKRYVAAPIQSLDGKWNVYDSKTWEKIHKNPYPLSSVEATAKALRDSFDDGEKVLVLKHITGTLRQNLDDLQYLVESENDLDIAKKIKPLQASITEEMERINKTGIKSEINFKQELKKFKSKFDEIEKLFDSLEESSPEINQIKEAFSEVSEDGVNAWITANSEHKAKKYHEAKSKGVDTPISKDVEKTVGTGTQGMLDDLERVTPEKRFNSKEEALSWINDNNEYTFLEWDKQVSNSVFDKVEKQAKLIGNVMLQMLAKDFNRRNQDGLNLYKNISQILKSDKAASLFLLDAGIDGIKYPAESIAAGRTSDTARGFNYVIFDENAINIEDVIKFQKDANKARGAVMVGMDGQAVIYALTNPNVSTPLHELAHVYEHYLTDAEKDTVLKSAGTKEWTTETSEYFARGFEKYIAEGKSPSESLSNVFEKFKQWLKDIYKDLKNSPIDVKLNDGMRKIYAQMLGAQQAKAETKVETKTEVKAETPSTKALPSFAEFDAISADRGKMKEAKAAFIEKHGQLAYDAMKEISTNFTKISKALQEKEILTKKC